MVKLDINVAGAIVQIIDLAAKTGAFTGQDLTSVGKIREIVVEQVQQAQQGETASDD